MTPLPIVNSNAIAAPAVTWLTRLGDNSTPPPSSLLALSVPEKWSPVTEIGGEDAGLEPGVNPAAKSCPLRVHIDRPESSARDKSCSRWR